MPHSAVKARLTERKRLLFAVLTSLATGMFGCLLPPPAYVVEAMVKVHIASMAMVALDDDRYAYARPDRLQPEGTGPRILGRGVLNQNNGWADLRDEIRKVGTLSNPKGELIIQPAKEREKNLEMIVEACEEAGVKYVVCPPSEDALDLVVEPVSAGELRKVKR